MVLRETLAVITGTESSRDMKDARMTTATIAPTVHTIQLRRAHPRFARLLSAIQL